MSYLRQLLSGKIRSSVANYSSMNCPHCSRQIGSNIHVKPKPEGGISSGKLTLGAGVVGFIGGAIHKEYEREQEMKKQQDLQPQNKA